MANFKRSLNFALNDFWRNKGISAAAIFILAITAMLFTAIFYVNGLSSYLITSVQNRIDITAYFKSDTAEQDILKIMDDIKNSSSGIKKVDYISQDQALKNFTDAHKGNDVFAKALSQVGDNPFLPSLNITTSGDPAQYKAISDILTSDQFSKFIDNVDFSQKEGIIDKVFEVTSGISRFGLGLAIILGLLALLVVLNTIKLAIETSKDEINTMQIVGASRNFVRAPFIIQGIIFGLIAFVVCVLLTFLPAYFLSDKLQVVTPGFSLFDFSIQNIAIIILIQFAASVGLGAFSSYIVVSKYLKV